MSQPVKGVSQAASPLPWPCPGAPGGIATPASGCQSYLVVCGRWEEQLFPQLLNIVIWVFRTTPSFTETFMENSNISSTIPFPTSSTSSHCPPLFYLYCRHYCIKSSCIFLSEKKQSRVPKTWDQQVSTAQLMLEPNKFSQLIPF